MPDFTIGDYVYFQTPGSRAKGYGRIQRVETDYLAIATSREVLRVAPKNCHPAPTPDSLSITPRNAPRLNI